MTYNNYDEDHYGDCYDKDVDSDNGADYNDDYGGNIHGVDGGILTMFSSYRVVDFANEGDLRRAVKKLDGSELLGKRIRLVEVNTCSFNAYDF